MYTIGATQYGVFLKTPLADNDTATVWRLATKLNALVAPPIGVASAARQTDADLATGAPTKAGGAGSAVVPGMPFV